MKNKLRIIPFLMILILMYAFVFVVGNPVTDAFMDFNHIYKTHEDRYISNIIETTFREIVSSQNNHKNSKSDLDNIDVNVKLNNVDMACYFISVYSTGYFDNKMEEALEANGYKYNFHTRDIKRKMLSRRGGEGSSAIIFIKDDGTMFPIFPPGSYLEFDLPVETLYKHKYPCEKIEYKNVDINVKFNSIKKTGKLLIKY